MRGEIGIFHSPTIIKVRGVVSLSFLLLTCSQKMQNCRNPNGEGGVGGS